MNQIFSILKPKNPLPLFFDSPHSGAHYPADFAYACDFAELQKAEDKHVDALFEGAPLCGAGFLVALFPRSYIDVNRAQTDIDPLVLADSWPHGPLRPTARSDAGIGLIRRLVRPGLPVYDRALGAAEIQHRLETYYHPYHDALKTALDALHYDFGQVWHVNCHSMPAASAYPRHGIGLAGQRAQPADIVLGDRDGASCDPDFTHEIAGFLRARGYRVTLNDPFKGAELITRYAAPARGRHSLQIEINKSLYMDEETNRKSARFDALKADMDALMAHCAAFVSARLVNLAAD